MDRQEEIRLEVFKKITYILLRLKFQANQKGYRFLREAVWIAYVDPEAITCVTKLLYPEVAKRFRTNDKQVERAIRTSIECAWERGNQELLFEMFYERSKNKGNRPTNTEVVEELVKYVNKESETLENIC